MAQPTTLTGSIGIFGMIPDASELITKKLGVKIDGVKTNKLADMGDMSRPFNAEEGALIQGMVNSGYELFTKRCAEGRNMPIDSLKMIAEGRVWSGEMAKELKLVDELGNLECAIKKASELCGIRDYKVASYPKKVDFITSLISNENLDKADRLQARMPFEISIN